MPPDVTGGRHEGFSLFFDMNVLFEEYIGRTVQRVMRDSGVTVSLQGKGGNQRYVARDSKGNGAFAMKPDIVGVREGGYEWILDTKWKMLSQDEWREGVAQSDLYQMYASTRCMPMPDVCLCQLLRLAEGAVLVAIGLLCPILMPEQIQRHPFAACFAVNGGPVGLGAPSLGDGCGREQSCFQLGFRHACGQGPGQGCQLGATQIVRDRGATDIDRHGDLPIGSHARARSAAVILLQFYAWITSCLPSATSTKSRGCHGYPVRRFAIVSGGRIHLESVAGFRWNGWPVCRGISGRVGAENAKISPAPAGCC